jgi:hypothetical protein
LNVELGCNLSRIDADAKTFIDDAFSFIATAAFDGPGQLRHSQVSEAGETYTLVEGNDDFAIGLPGLTPVGTDFHL